MLERLQKIMAHAGVASRRKCEELIKQGKVKVNGSVITIGDKADIRKDTIEVSGKKITKKKKIYLIVNKPKGVLSASSDKYGKTIIDLVGLKERLYPVGRLDRDSTGIMILTNDGDFANTVMHPRYNVKKRYKVMLDKALRKEDVEKILKGVVIESRKVNVYDFEFQGKIVQLSIHEGRKHIVKKLFSELSYTVASLMRVSIGNLKLTLEEGSYETVTKDFLKSKIF